MCARVCVNDSASSTATTTRTTKAASSATQVSSGSIQAYHVKCYNVVLGVVIIATQSWRFSALTLSYINPSIHPIQAHTHTHSHSDYIYISPYASNVQLNSTDSAYARTLLPQFSEKRGFGPRDELKHKCKQHNQQIECRSSEDSDNYVLWQAKYFFSSLGSDFSPASRVLVHAITLSCADGLEGDGEKTDGGR